MELTAVEKIFLDIISNFSSEHLRQAIKDNISLANLIKKEAPYIIRVANSIKAFYINQKDLLTSENILEYLRTSRKDFYYTITANPKNKEWFEIQVKETKSLLGI